MDDRPALRPVALNPGAASIPGAAPNLSEGSWIVFSLAGKRFALPMALVEAVVSPPPLAQVPHAPPALLGAANLAGQIVPIVDLARLIHQLGHGRHLSTYDGSGEIIRLRSPGGSVGLWVERVDRFLRAGPDDLAPLGDQPGSPDGPDGISLLDPIPLLAAGLAPPAIGGGLQAPLGDVAETLNSGAAPVIAESFISVDIGGTAVQLPRDTVIELIETVPWTRLPRPPAGFWGIGVLRGSALPILSLAALLGLPEPAAPGSLALIELDGYRALVAVDRVVGLRFRGEAAAEDSEPIEIGSLVSAELRQIVLGFSPIDPTIVSGGPADADSTSEYLAFAVGGQDFAVSIAAVDRVVEGQPLIRLPQTADAEGAASSVVGAIDLRGQIVPVASLLSRLGIHPQSAGPRRAAAYVILRGADGLGALGVDQVKQIERLRPDDIAPAPAEQALLEGVAALRDGALLRIIAPGRLWSDG